MDSGWNCTPSMWKSLCLIPMTSPSSERAVTRRHGGREFSATASEWYLTTSTGFGIPANTPVESCDTELVLPCIILFAETISPPKA